MHAYHHWVIGPPVYIWDILQCIYNYDKTLGYNRNFYSSEQTMSISRYWWSISTPYTEIFFCFTLLSDIEIHYFRKNMLQIAFKLFVFDTWFVSLNKAYIWLYKSRVYSIRSFCCLLFVITLIEPQLREESKYKFHALHILKISFTG